MNNIKKIAIALALTTTLTTVGTSVMQAYVRTYTAGSGVLSAGVIAFFVEVVGVSGPIGGLVGALSAYQCAYFYDVLVNNDYGKGVYCDGFWGSMKPTNFKYYGA